MSTRLAANTAFMHSGPQFSDVAVSKKYQTQDEKAHFLAQETGMELILAEEFLSSNNWNLSEAIKGYKELLELEKKKKADNSRIPERNLKKIGRGFSLSNFNLVQQARENLVVEEKAVDENALLAMSARRSFVLPDISQFGKVLAAFIREDLISASTMHSLTARGRLNWWSDIGACRKLFPLSTIGDGNCLLHAASLGMWGFHDRLLKLRKALHLMLLSPNAKKAIKRRWKYNMWKENMKSGSLMFSRDEWEDEWEEIVKLASGKPHRYDSSQPRPRRISRVALGISSGDGLREGESLDSLEDIHVYVLANLIRRPIIVISENMLKDSEGRDVAPIPFGGIYLPLEKPPEVCWKYPLVLAYHMSHFTALVPAEGESQHKGERLSTSVPLMDSTLFMLPIRFAIDPGTTWDLVQDDGVKEERPELTYEEKLNLLRKYLDVVKVTFNNGVAPSDARTPKVDRKNNLNKFMTQFHEMFIGLPPNILIAARLNMKERPNNYTEMIENYVSNARLRLQKLRIEKTKCLNSNCTMFSSPEFGGYCLLCHERRTYSPKPRPRGPPQTKVTVNLPIQNNSQPCSPNLIRPDRAERKHRSPSTSPRHTLDIGDPLYENAPYPVDRKHSNSSNSSASTDTSEPFGISPDDTTVHCYQNVGVSCQSTGCKFYGSLETKGYCSSCYRKKYQSSI